MRHLLFSLAFLAVVPVGTAPLYATSSAGLLPPVSDGSALSVPFTVDGDTAVPGAVLKSGNYIIRVVDHMSDRSIIRVEKADGRPVSTFLGVPNRTLASMAGQGPVTWNGGSEHDKALRGYNFPGNFSVEFVYPKAEAVKIATARSASVAAIDPASDNLPSKEKNLTNDDMRIVTLWTLTPTRVNGSTAIAAKKYAPVERAPAPPVVVARNEPPASLPAPTRVVPTAAPVRPQVAAAPPKPVAHRRTIATSLPHTASSLPLVGLAGMLSLFGILAIRTRKLLLES